MRSDPFDDGGDSHAAADAERGQAAASSRRSSSSTAVPRIIAPVAPSGWPIAMAPPLTLTFSCGHAQFAHEPERNGGERLVDLEEVDVVESRPALASALRVAGRRPGEHHRRVRADERRWMIRARGRRPTAVPAVSCRRARAPRRRRCPTSCRRCGRARCARSGGSCCNATASNPAWAPMLAKEGVSAAKPSSVVSGRRCSSRSSRTMPLRSRPGQPNWRSSRSPRPWRRALLRLTA